MLWRLRYWLFGTQFVHLRNCVRQSIRPVRWTHSGKPYCTYSPVMPGTIIWLDDPQSETVTPMTQEIIYQLKTKEG